MDCASFSQHTCFSKFRERNHVLTSKASIETEVDIIICPTLIQMDSKNLSESQQTAQTQNSLTVSNRKISLSNPNKKKAESYQIQLCHIGFLLCHQHQTKTMLQIPAKGTNFKQTFCQGFFSVVLAFQKSPAFELKYEVNKMLLAVKTPTITVIHVGKYNQA